MRKGSLTLLIISILIMLLAGCTRKAPVTNIFYPVDSGSEQAQTKLAEAAVSSSDSLARLAAIEKATHPRAKVAPPMSYDHLVRIGLGTLTSVDWTGPIEPIVKELAHSAHYKFRVIGRRPAIPVLVNIYVTNMPVGDILRDANYQAGLKADVIIHPGRRIIELRYRPIHAGEHHIHSWKGGDRYMHSWK